MHFLVQPGIGPGHFGPATVNLGLIVLDLLQRGWIRSFAPPDQPTAAQVQALEAPLRAEISEAVFGGALQTALAWLQQQSGLGDQLGGRVDEQTAALLQQLCLKVLGQAPTQLPPDLRRLTAFSVSFKPSGSAFSLRFRPEGEPEQVAKISSPAALTLLTVKQSFRFFVYDAREKKLVGTDTLLD